MRWDMNKFILLVNLILVVMVGGVLYLNIGRPFIPKHGPREGMFCRERDADMAKELGISAEQVKKLQAHREAFRGKHMQAMNDLSAKRLAVAQELSKPQIDPDRINALHQELKDAMIREEDERLQDILQVREILGADKFKLFTEKIIKKIHNGPAPHERP